MLIRKLLIKLSCKRNNFSFSDNITVIIFGFHKENYISVEIKRFLNDREKVVPSSQIKDLFDRFLF